MRQKGASAQRIMAAAAALLFLALVASGCGKPPPGAVRAVGEAAGAAEHTAYDLRALRNSSVTPAERLPSIFEAMRQRKEYLDNLSNISADVLCNELQKMLDTRRFPSIEEWAQDLSAAIVNESLAVPSQLRQWTEAMIGATFNYLAGGSDTITVSDVEDTQASLC